MKKLIKSTLIKFLALAAAFAPIGKVKAETHENGVNPLKAQLTFFSDVEQDGNKPMYSEACLIPDISLGKDDKKVGFQGCYWRFGDTTGNISDWWRLSYYFYLENEDVQLRAGRILMREYAGYVYCPTTPRFDNVSTGKGVGLGFTGIHGCHKPTGIGLGVASSNNQMNPNDWDTGVLTWHHDWDGKYAVQTHIGATKHEVTRAGITGKWHPNDDFTLVGEMIYKGKELSNFLTFGYQITDSLKAFGGVEVTYPNSGKASGLLTAGLDYHLNNTGVHFFAGVHQELGEQHGTSVVVGARFQGILKMAGDAVNYRGL